VRETTAVRVHFIIEMTDWTPGKVERNGELGQPNDRYIEDNNKQTLSEEGSGMVHEETRSDPAVLIDLSENV
jgi:hypothetical protein